MPAVVGTCCLIEAPLRDGSEARPASSTGPGSQALLAALLLVAAALPSRSGAGPAPRAPRWLLGAGVVLALLAVATALLVAPRRAVQVADPLPPRAVHPPRLQGLEAPRPSAQVSEVPVLARDAEPPLRGVVRDAAGRPVPGVALWTAPAGGAFLEAAHVRVATSGADGAFALPLPPDAAASWILARGDGYLPHGRALTPPYDGVAVVLEKGRCVRGRVVDDAGAAVEGAAVEAWGVLGEDVGGTPGTLFGGVVLPEFARCVSDARGEFELCGLPPGAVRVLARRAGYHSPSVGAPVLVGPGDPPPIALVLAAIHVLRARAVDQGTGQALPSASYELVMPPGSGWVTAADSAARYPLLRRAGSGLLNAESVYAEFRRSGEAGGTAAAMTLIVTAPGYARRVVEVPLRPYSQAGEVLPIELPRAGAEPLVPVRFQARWPDGEGLTGSLLVRVGLRDTSPPRWATPYLPMRFVEGTCDGAVELPPGPYFARARGHEGSTVAWSAATTRSTFDVVAGASDATATLLLEGGRLQVDVRTEEGVAVRDFTLSVTGPGAGITFSTWQSAVPCTTAGSAERPREGGLWLFLDPGSTHLVLTKEGFQKVEHTLVLEPGGRVTTWRPRLERR